jgi:hypothetical protein
MRPLTSVDCDRASKGFFGVCDTYISVIQERGSGGVGVRNLISSFDITTSRLKGISPDPLNPLSTFCLIIDLTKAALNAIKNSSLVI